MRRIVTAISAAALAFSMVSLAAPASAAGGFDSAYAGESAFLTLNPGQGGTFTVFFANTGTNAWTKGTATQVDLAACLEDKVTCNQQDASEATFNPSTGGWLSSTRYATTTQTSIAPGGIGTFTYNVSVPNTATGLHRFNGALVVSTTGADVHNEGYYQDVNIPGQQASCTPSTITTSPTTAQEIVGSTHTQVGTVLCSDGKASANAAVTFAIQAPVGSLNANLTLTGTTDTTGKVSVTWSRSNPDTDSVDVFPTAQPNIRATATIFWVVKPVISCTPTTSGTTLNGQTRIFTIALTKPSDGTPVTTATNISVGVNPAVAKGTASINGTAVDTNSDANATANKQLTFVTTDANGNATLTVSGTNSTITAVVWLEETSFGGTNEQAPGTDTVNAAGNHVNTLESSEFQATCGTTTFQAVTAVTVAVTPSTAATVARSSQRVYTVTATDTAGNPTAATVNLGFAENLLSTVGTSARIVWFDIDAAAADQGGSQTSASSASRQSLCQRVKFGTYIAAEALGASAINSNDGAGNAVVRDASNATKNDKDASNFTTSKCTSFNNISGLPTVLAKVLVPSIGRATFAIVDEVDSDTATPLAWQDTEATADFIPQTGEPQAQGGTTTFVKPVVTTGIVFSQISGGNDILPASNSAGETGVVAPWTSGLGLEQFTFRIRNQSRNAFFPELQTGQTAGSCATRSSTALGLQDCHSGDIGQTVIWTVQNTGTSNVFVVSYDASPNPVAAAQTQCGGAVVVGCVPPGQSLQFQSPILASGTDCTPGGRDRGGTTISSLGGSAEYGQTDCFNSANIMLNAGSATSATVTGTLVSNGAMSGNATIQWVSATAEPANGAGVQFTAAGTVIAVQTFEFNVQEADPGCSSSANNINTGGLPGTQNQWCYYLLQTASGTIYKINFGSDKNVTVGNNQSGHAHDTDTYIYLGSEFAGQQICTDSGISYLPCHTIQTGADIVHGPGNVACGTIVGDCTEEPLSQFANILSTGNKVTFTNGGPGLGASGPAIGTAIHNITATQ